MATISLAARRRLALILRRMPWLVGLAKAGLRLTRAHFTAGAVGVVLNREGKILLVEHVFHPKYPWGLPGGWVERGESPATTLKRELLEETGIVAEDLHLLLAERVDGWNHLDIAFLCRAANDVQALGPELLDYRWVAFDQLPPMIAFHQAAVKIAQARGVGEV